MNVYRCQMNRNVRKHKTKAPLLIYTNIRITSRLNYCYYKPDRVRKNSFRCYDNNIERIMQIGTQSCCQ